MCGKAIVQNSLSGNLGGNGDSECQPCELEAVPKKIKVSNGEDSRHDGSVGNSGGTCAIYCQHNVIILPEALWENAGPPGGTYEDCSMKGARKRMSGSVSKAGRSLRGSWESDERRPGWRTRHWSLRAGRGHSGLRGLY